MPTEVDKEVDLYKVIRGLEKKVLNVQDLDRPCFVMNFPLSLSTDNPNNVWMQRMNPLKRLVDFPKAYKQWTSLYGFLSSLSLVYLLPSVEGYQDQVYVANVGLVPPHLRRVVLLARYKSPPRRGEEYVAEKFFELLGFHAEHPKYDWEGEADTKHIRDNIYVGGYGIRTDAMAYKWMYDEMDMEIIPIRMQDDFLYHFDCMFFPLNREEALVCVELISDKEKQLLEKVVNIIPVSKEEARQGMTNCVRVDKCVLCSSNINDLKADNPEYEVERKKIDNLTRICLERGMEPVFFNLSEYEKSGAALSCLVMHLNRFSYAKK